jgi:hypothetical protein
VDEGLLLLLLLPSAGKGDLTYSGSTCFLPFSCNKFSYLFCPTSLF